MREIAHLPREPVKAKERLPHAFIDIMDASAVDIDEASDRRYRVFDPARRPHREENKSAKDENEDRQDTAKHPNRSTHVFTRRLTEFQYLPSMSRSSSAANLASQPTISYARRFSTPRTRTTPNLRSPP